MPTQRLTDTRSVTVARPAASVNYHHPGTVLVIYNNINHRTPDSSHQSWVNISWDLLGKTIGESFWKYFCYLYNFHQPQKNYILPLNWTSKDMVFRESHSYTSNISLLSLSLLIYGPMLSLALCLQI